MDDGDSKSFAARPSVAQFPPTLWSVVLTAGGDSSSRAEEALAALCRAYWPPLYAYVRRRGESPHDAQDAVQSFFVHLLEKHSLAHVHPAKGKFRSFLLASLRNFLADEQRKHRAQKRGGAVEIVSFNVETAEGFIARETVDTTQDPEKTFERRWALTLLDRVLARLKEEYAASGRAQRYEALSPLLLSGEAQSTYAQVGRQLGLSEGAVKMAVLRLRQRGRELFREEVAQTVSTEAEVEDEVRHIVAALAG